MTAMDDMAGGFPICGQKSTFMKVDQHGPRKGVSNILEKIEYGIDLNTTKESVHNFSLQQTIIILVGGWTTHLEEYAGSSNWIISPILGVKIKNI